MKTVNVNLGQRSYPIIIGNGCGKKLSVLLKKNNKTGRLFVFYDANFYALHGKAVRRQLKGRPAKIFELVIPSGERSKSTKELNKIYDYLLGCSIGRDDFILACGGGVLSDLVGYAASTTLRGISWGVLSTTLLGMVDASIGGKTGINHTAGKNLIGAFWQPRFVVCDSSYLATLPPRELIAGLGEILKYAGLSGGRLISSLEKLIKSGKVLDHAKLLPLIEPCVKYKAQIVSKDEREGSLRMRLNLGHTFAHGIENSLGYGKLLHGEAVILGLLAAVELSELVSPGSMKKLNVYKNVTREFIRFLPKRKINPSKVLSAMKLDKKRGSGKNRFLLLEGTGKPIIADRINAGKIKSSLEKMLAYYQVHGGYNASHTGR